MSISKFSKEVLMDITETISVLRENGLIRDERGVAQHDLPGNLLEFTFDGKNEASKIMLDKHVSCAQVVDKLLLERQYTVLLYDKSLLQAEFIIDMNHICKERLSFIKKHNKIWQISEIDEYEYTDEDWFSEEAGIPIMIRIDYDPQNHEECKHAAAHLTLSNHKSCRIPMKSAIPFSEFVRFVLLHFYDTDLHVPKYRFSGEDTITERERKLIHINWV